jgi:lysophospholipase L1-like esterase
MRQTASQDKKENKFMKKLPGVSWLAVMVSLAVLTARAQPAPPAAAAPVADKPAVIAAPAPPRANTAIMPKLSAQFQRAHAGNVELAKKGDIDLLFMGDSITDWWRNTGRGTPIEGAIPYGGKAVFDQHFGALKVANFGIAGDTTQGVLWRLQNGEGEGYKPKAIMLMIGTNNTGQNSPPEIAVGIANIVFELRKDFPEAKILLLGIFPRTSGGPSVTAKINEINKIIPALNDNQHVFYMDIGSKFLAADGSLPKEIMSDGLHPTSKGYEIWAEAVHDTLVSWMQ